MVFVLMGTDFYCLCCSIVNKIFHELILSFIFLSKAKLNIRI